MKKWIVFDVDDVICNFRESLHQSFKQLGKDIHWSTWEIYKHVDIYQLNNEKELLDHMRDYQVIEKAIVEDLVKDLFERLKEKGYYIGLLTARGWHDQGQELTHNFVDKYKLLVDKVVISGQHMDKKSAHIDKFDGKVVAYIDDSIHHVADFNEQGVLAFLLNRPWNIKNNELPRVDNLLEFEQHIYSLENNAKVKIKV